MLHPKEMMTELIVKKSKRIIRVRGERFAREGVPSSGSSVRVRALNFVWCISLARSWGRGAGWASTPRGMKRWSLADPQPGGSCTPG